MTAEHKKIQAALIAVEKRIKQFRASVSKSWFSDSDKQALMKRLYEQMLAHRVLLQAFNQTSHTHEQTTAGIFKANVSLTEIEKTIATAFAPQIDKVMAVNRQLSEVEKNLALFIRQSSVDDEYLIRNLKQEHAKLVPQLKSVTQSIAKPKDEDDARYGIERLDSLSNQINFLAERIQKASDKKEAAELNRAFKKIQHVPTTVPGTEMLQSRLYKGSIMLRGISGQSLALEGIQSQTADTEKVDDIKAVLESTKNEYGILNRSLKLIKTEISTFGKDTLPAKVTQTRKLLDTVLIDIQKLEQQMTQNFERILALPDAPKGNNPPKK
jgi:hypothetical protein